MSAIASLICPECGAHRTECLVQQGSYVVRCSACGTDIVATSFLSMQFSTEHFAAYHDPGAGRAPEQGSLIANGPLSKIHATVASVASQGKSVLLLPQP